jgi:hypothetical protein
LIQRVLDETRWRKRMGEAGRARAVQPGFPGFVRRAWPWVRYVSTVITGPFATAVPRLIVGKLLNAGQTCIAPDYALVPASRLDEFVATVTTSVQSVSRHEPTNRDYTSIVNARHPSDCSR